MLNDNKHIDSLFVDGLKNLSVPPNPKVWEGINTQMLAEKRKRRLVVYIWAGIAASILLLLAIGNRYLSDQPTYNMQLNTISENSMPIEKNANKGVNQAEQNEQSSIGNSIAKGVETDKNLFSEKSKTEQLNPATQNTLFDSEKEASTSISEKIIAEGSNSDRHIYGIGTTNSLNSKPVFVTKENDIAFLDNEFVYVPMNLNGIEELLNFGYNLPDQLEVDTNQLFKEQPVLLLADEIQIQKNLLAIEQLSHQESKKNRWSLIGQISSTYSSYSGDSKGNNMESGIWSVGGGAKVSYAMNRKLAFQTGIVYNRFGQDLRSRRGYDLLQSDVNIVSGEEGIPDIREGAQNIVAYPVETSAGPVKLNSSNPMDATTEFVSSYSSSSSDLIQSFKSIEIPLLMRYNLIQNRIGMFVSGGLSANMIVGNGVYDQSSGNTKIGEIDDIRTTNFSSLFSFGIEYQLSSKLQIGLEPSVKYYINSISKNNKYEYKPYSIGVFTGIRYNF